MTEMNPKVEAFMAKTKTWREESEKLRSILHDFPLSEDLKWGKPCFAFQGSNFIIIIAFKEYCALAFFKGSLLSDPNGLLVKPGENTQGGRQIRFNNIQEIVALEPVIRAYIQEAIDVEKAGLQVDKTASKELVFPDELHQKFDEMPALAVAFQVMTPGRQRAYNMHFSAPKQSTTRMSRIEKCIPKILEGKGMND